MSARNKRARRAGFSLIEVVVSIAILGLVTVPICSSFVLAHRINAKSQQLMLDRLAVAGAAEELMANGIDWEALAWSGDECVYNGIELTRQSDGGGYTVTVTRGDVSVETWVRELPAEGGTTPLGEGGA